MKEKNVEVVIVGGGPAGLAAAVELYRRGVHNIVILEREAHLGGILRQCIHDGFGLTRFKRTLSGPEYAKRFIDEAENLQIPYQVNTTVVDISLQRCVTAVSPAGITQYHAKAVVLAMGCRERTRGALAIPGERPCGVLTAGVAQSYLNLHNLMVGKNAVILGSGDIGLIMARRLTLEGAKVLGVYELQPYPSGLPRNVRQCLEDYDIPLHLSHTVTQIHGSNRLTGVTVSRVDETLQPVPGTEQHISCDTLILSVGLIPENELSKQAGVRLDERTKGPKVDEFYQTTVPGIFAAGNVLQVHDLVDFVSQEAERLAAAVALYLTDGLPGCGTQLLAGKGVGYVVPGYASGQHNVVISLRVQKPMQNAMLTVRENGRVVWQKKVGKALPAEMIHSTLPDNILAANSLEVSVQ